MDCSLCKVPARWAFELLEDVAGEGPVKRRVCFHCISKLGEEFARPPRIEIFGPTCPDCMAPVPPGFYTCRGSGSHQSVPTVGPR